MAKQRSPVQSAGIILYRFRAGSAEVLLVHPGGPYWAKNDEGAWSIPKGEFDAAEDPLTAAIRELKEETGIDASGEFFPLEPVQQKSGKIVFAWCLEKDVDASDIKSNLFEMEWPPRSGNKRLFPEIDRAAWFNLDESKKKILPGQLPLISALEDKLRSRD
jgi:predicted NUDIX family NTP pyrophosphohydrolase